MKKNSLIYLTLMLVIFIGEVSAVTYYVSPTGLDSDPGSESNPFKTIQKAADIVNPGDTVIVKDGEYADTNDDKIILSLLRGGKVGQLGSDQYGNSIYDPTTWITFKAKNRRRAILNGKNSAAVCIDVLAPASYLVIEGFEIKNCRNVGIRGGNLQSTQNIRVEDNLIHNIGRHTSCYNSLNCSESLPTYGYGQAGIYLGANHRYWTFARNVIHTIGRYGLPKPDWHDHGMYIYGDHAVIKNNIFFNMTSGWSIKLSGNNYWLNKKCSGDCGSFTKIINNTFSGASTDRPGQLNLWGAMHNVLVKNNIFYDPVRAAIYNYSGTKGDNVKIINNLTNNG